MRIVMNGLAAVKPKTGVGHYVANLHAALMQRTDVDVTLYPAPDLAHWAGRGYRLVGTGGGGGGPSLAGHVAGAVKHLGKIAVGVHFAGTCRAAGYDLYHEPNFVPLPSDRPTVVTVHDLSVLLYPQWHPADRVRHHERHFLPAVRRAAHLIAVSDHVRNELVRELGIDPSRVTAVPNGISTDFRRLPATIVEDCRRRLNLPPRFVLCVGTVEPRKNLLAVLKAFVDLPPTIRERCPLVLAGPWGWRSDVEHKFFDATAGPAGVRRLGYVSATDLPAVYNAASALLYPSWYEGFGLPPVEMLACGGAVVCAEEALAVREVVGSYGTFLPGGDVTAWREMMKRIADGDSISSAVGIEHAARFTWQAAAATTVGVYARVLGRGSTARAA